MLPPHIDDTMIVRRRQREKENNHIPPIPTSRHNILPPPGGVFDATKRSGTEETARSIPTRRVPIDDRRRRRRRRCGLLGTYYLLPFGIYYRIAVPVV